MMCHFGGGIVIYMACVNSLRQSDEYMPQWARPSLAQIIACRLIGAKPLSEAMLDYC